MMTTRRRGITRVQSATSITDPELADVAQATGEGQRDRRLAGDLTH